MMIGVYSVLSISRYLEGWSIFPTVVRCVCAASEGALVQVPAVCCPADRL
jgi:hypothetical protein